MLDLLLFDGMSFYENKELEEKYPNYKTYYKRNNKYGVLPGKDLFVCMVDNGDYKVSPCLQFCRADYLRANSIFFPKGIIHEDNLFAYHAIIFAKRASHFPAELFLRRVRTESTMTSAVGMKNLVGYSVCVHEMMKFISLHKSSSDVILRTNRQILGYWRTIRNIFDNYLSEPERMSVQNNEKINLFSLDLAMFLYQQTLNSAVIEECVKQKQKEISTKIFTVIDDKLNRLKKEIDAKMTASIESKFNQLRKEMSAMQESLIKKLDYNSEMRLFLDLGDESRKYLVVDERIYRGRNELNLKFDLCDYIYICHFTWEIVGNHDCIAHISVCLEKMNGEEFNVQLSKLLTNGEVRQDEIAFYGVKSCWIRYPIEGIYRSLSIKGYVEVF